MNSFSTEKKDIRRFGLTALVFFGVLFALGLWREKFILGGFFGVLAIAGLALALAPQPLQPFYRGWMVAAHFIGRAITILMLSIAYYLVITPSAMIKRLFGGRPLPVRPDKDAVSYWVPRDEPLQPKERFIKRF